jgi:hypothetical protein
MTILRLLLLFATVTLCSAQQMRDCSKLIPPTNCAGGLDTDCKCLGRSGFGDAPASHCAPQFTGDSCQYKCYGADGLVHCLNSICAVDGMCQLYRSTSSDDPAPCQNGWSDTLCSRPCQTQNCIVKARCLTSGFCEGYNWRSDGIESMAVHCETGFFGTNCRNRCDNCAGPCNMDGRCHGFSIQHLSPNCRPRHCVSGWYGDYCSNPCGTPAGTCIECGDIDDYCLTCNKVRDDRILELPSRWPRLCDSCKQLMNIVRETSTTTSAELFETGATEAGYKGVARFLSLVSPAIAVANLALAHSTCARIGVLGGIGCDGVAAPSLLGGPLVALGVIAGCTVFSLAVQGLCEQLPLPPVPEVMLSEADNVFDFIRRKGGEALCFYCRGSKSRRAIDGARLRQAPGNVTRVAPRLPWPDTFVAIATEDRGPGLRRFFRQFVFAASRAQGVSSAVMLDAKDNIVSAQWQKAVADRDEEVLHMQSFANSSEAQRCVSYARGQERSDNLPNSLLRAVLADVLQSAAVARNTTTVSTAGLQVFEFAPMIGANSSFALGSVVHTNVTRWRASLLPINSTRIDIDVYFANRSRPLAVTIDANFQTVYALSFWAFNEQPPAQELAAAVAVPSCCGSDTTRCSGTASEPLSAVRLLQESHFIVPMASILPPVLVNAMQQQTTSSLAQSSSSSSSSATTLTTDNSETASVSTIVGAPATSSASPANPTSSSSAAPQVGFGFAATASLTISLTAMTWLAL